MSNFKIGQGYDIHHLVLGRRLILAGVEIPFKKGLEGHSDADVAAHAIMDSLLGAAGLDDIGSYFPNNDPLYKDADSMNLMANVREMVIESGYSIGNVDVTIIAEEPKLAPYINDMKDNIARALNISRDNISVKATTNEELGPVGRGEGIAALAVSLLYK